MKIGKYELGFNKRRIWAERHQNMSNDDGIVYEPNVCIPVSGIYKHPLKTVRHIVRVFCGKQPF